MKTPNRKIVGSSPQMSDIYQQISTYCNLTMPVVIEGETGVGKTFYRFYSMFKFLVRGKDGKVVAESGNILGLPLPAEAVIVILFGQLPKSFLLLW